MLCRTEGGYWLMLKKLGNFLKQVILAIHEHWNNSREFRTLVICVLPCWAYKGFSFEGLVYGFSVLFVYAMITAFVEATGEPENPKKEGM